MQAATEILCWLNRTSSVKNCVSKKQRCKYELVTLWTSIMVPFNAELLSRVTVPFVVVDSYPKWLRPLYQRTRVNSKEIIPFSRVLLFPRSAVSCHFSGGPWVLLLSSAPLHTQLFSFLQNQVFCTWQLQVSHSSLFPIYVLSGWGCHHSDPWIRGDFIGESTCRHIFYAEITGRR